MRRNFFYIFSIFIAVSAFGTNLYAEEDYYNEDEDIIYEEFVFNEDSTDRLIDETVDEKRRQKQERLGTDTTIATDVNYKEIDKAKWEEYNGKRDYIEKEKEKKEASNMPKFGFEGLGFIAQLIKVIVYAVVILGLAFLIFKLFEAQFKADKAIVNDKKFHLEKLEEQIHEVDLNKLLEEYRNKKDFSMMIRIQYLMVIKALSERKIIDWQKQKTNGAYLQELYGHNLFLPFQKVTRLYERIWFGEVILDEPKYEEIAHRFEQILNQINKINIG